jgi:glycosyltransferase involved in cell wall biosynthesis
MVATVIDAPVPATSPLDATLDTVCVTLGGVASPPLGPQEFGNWSYIEWSEFRTLVRANPAALRRRIGGRQLVLSVAYAGARPLVPHFLVLSWLLRPSRLVLIEPDRPAVTVGYADVARALMEITTATLRAIWLLASFFLRGALQRAGRRRPLESPLGGGEVLYLKTNYSFSETAAGGSVGHTAGVVNALSRLDVDTRFVTAEPFAHLDDRVPMVRSAVPRTAPLVTAWYGLLLAESLAHEATTSAAGAQRCWVYQRLVPYDAAGLTVARRLHAPWMVEYNGSEAWISRRWGRGGALLGLLAAFERHALQAADRIGVVSDVLKDELLEIGIPEDRIRVYPNGVDPTRYSPALVAAASVSEIRARLGADRDTLLCTFVGTFGRWHGAEVLAQAISEWCVGSDPTERRVMFLFVGDGLMMPEVRRCLGQWADSPWVTFTGAVPQEEAIQYLAASDVLLSPHVANADGSRFFGSPTKLFEYMAMEKAIVASDLEQIGDVLQPALRAADLSDVSDPSASDPHVAILCRPGVTEDIHRSIAFLLDRPAWRKSLGRQARSRVLQRYTWEHHVRALFG